MSGLLLQLRRSVRRILLPIQCRLVTLCKLYNFEIVPNRVSCPLFFAFLAETWAAWWIRCLSVLPWRAPWDGPFLDLESIVHQFDPCSICTFLSVERKASSEKDKNNAFRPTCQIGKALYFRRYVTHLEVLHVSRAADHFLRFFAEWVVRLILPQVGVQRLSIWMRFELMTDCTLRVWSSGCTAWWTSPWIRRSISPVQVFTL